MAKGATAAISSEIPSNSVTPDGAGEDQAPAARGPGRPPKLTQPWANLVGRRVQAIQLHVGQGIGVGGKVRTGWSTKDPLMDAEMRVVGPGVWARRGKQEVIFPWTNILKVELEAEDA